MSSIADGVKRRKRVSLPKKLEPTPKKLKSHIQNNEATGDEVEDFIKPFGKNLSKQFEATDEDYKEVARVTRSDVQSELAGFAEKGRQFINDVNNLPGIPSKSDNRMREIIVEGKKPSENTGGGILEMFGLAGGRRRRRRKSRRKKRRKSRKSRRKRRKRTKKKRRRKSRKKSRR